MRIFDLPDGYIEVHRVNLQEDKRTAILVNAWAVAIMMILFIFGLIFFPFNVVYKPFSLVAFLLSTFLYILGHELVHAVFIRKYSGKNAKIGYTGMYAYAGSDAYFNKRQYIIIALSPVVFFGLVFLFLNVYLPKEWFWPIYILQIMNLSGAAGDFYITYLMRKLPSDILIQDTGIEMAMYSRT